MRMRAPSARRTATAAIAVVLMLVLSGCFDMKGELTIDSDGRISGNQRVEFPKESGAAMGITSLDMFKLMLEDDMGGMLGGDLGGDLEVEDADDSCPGGFSFEETDTAFAAVCAFENQDPGESNDMFGIQRVGDTIELDFTNDMTEEDAAMMAMMGMGNMAGSIDVTFNFPGEVQAITGTTAAKATQVDGDTVRIQGALMEAIDVKIVSAASGGSGGGITVPTPGGNTGADTGTGNDTDTGTGTDSDTDTGSTDNDSTDGETTAVADDDGGSNLGLIIAAVVIILLLLAVIGFLVLRGRGKKDTAQPAFAGAPAGAAPGAVAGQQDTQQWAQQPPAQTQAMPTQALPTQQPEAAPQSPQAAAPGWYPMPGDPSGQPRYWDGTSWSNPQQ